MIRITAAASATIIDAANQYAMCIGQSSAEIDTYQGLNWQDADGNLYAATSFMVSPEWLVAAQEPLVRPAWDTTGIVDMVLAEQGQAALVFWSPDMTTPVPMAAPGALTAYANSGVQEALAVMGLAEVNDPAAGEK